MAVGCPVIRNRVRRDALPGNHFTRITHPASRIPHTVLNVSAQFLYFQRLDFEGFKGQGDLVVHNGQVADEAFHQAGLFDGGDRETKLDVCFRAGVGRFVQPQDDRVIVFGLFDRFDDDVAWFDGQQGALGRQRRRGGLGHLPGARAG